MAKEKETRVQTPKALRMEIGEAVLNRPTGTMIKDVATKYGIEEHTAVRFKDQYLKSKDKGKAVVEVKEALPSKVKGEDLETRLERLESKYDAAIDTSLTLQTIVMTLGEALRNRKS